MTPRELVLLSPYRLPAQHPVTLADEDMAAWLNGYSALWHPLALWQASSPPRIDAVYEHDTPRPGYIYAVPQTPASLLSDDWDNRVHAVGACAFRATTDRAATFVNFKASCGSSEVWRVPTALADLPPATVAPFLGIGLGFLLLSALSEAMEHENLLQVDEFWSEIQQAVGALLGVNAETTGGKPPVAPFLVDDPRTVGATVALQAAANRLLAARETLYPVAIHLLDLVLLEEQNLNDPWPITVTHGQPINVLATGAELERLQRENPEALSSLAEAITTGFAEVCGGGYLERADALLPVESQLWNLRKGLAVSKGLLGDDVRVYARRRFGAHPQLPAWLNHHGLTRAVLLPTDDAGLPAYSSPVMIWSTPEGQQVDCFIRKPLATDSIDTFFNLGYQLYKTTREDHTATLAFIHGGKPALPWYGDLLELSKLAAVAGKCTTITNYFGEASTGDHAGSLSGDDFHFDYLSERVCQESTVADPAVDGVQHAPSAVTKAYHSSLPVSGFSQHIRLRRRFDTCWTLAAMQRGLAGRGDPQQIEKPLLELEDALESVAANVAPHGMHTRLADLESQIAGSLADRLVAKAQTQSPGYLLLNPCSFTRRLALELKSDGLPMPVVDPVKAVQVDGDTLRIVAEVPPLGFAWLPRSGTGTASGASRMRLADDRCVRNEFFEAEIDHATGGLRAIRDHRTQVNRISERLIFRPGSVMKASQVKTTSTGPAMGEIVSEGALLGPQGQELAKFRQRFRAWVGRPILEMRVELFPEQKPAGSPWHAYYGAQFAWRDEHALLVRGLDGMGQVTTRKRPQTPDYLEIRQGRQSTTIFPGGLPFHQREGGRMLDVILVTAGEPTTAFDFAIGLDREQPMQTALGLVTPATVVPVAKGPPHIGAKGWLFHLDAANLVLTSMRPGGRELLADGSGLCDFPDAVTVRLLECAGQSTSAELRCARNPQRVALLDARGQLVMPGTQNGDAALFHAGPGSFLQLQVQFSL